MGEYSVKSRDKWCITTNQSEAYTDTNLKNDALKTYYTRLWSLNIPNKIRIHLWKVTNNCLPTFQNLQYMILRNKALCSICAMEDEPIAHIF